MTTYLYLDYGGQPKYRQELKYSLISLKADLGAKWGDSQTPIAVYTDTPSIYRNWPVTAVSIAGKLNAWSGGGLYYHRIKPEVVRDALSRFSGPVCFVDADSIIRPGFDAEVSARMADAVVMNVLEKKNPYPPLSGFRCRLPHLGGYRYDVRQSLMYNSGLIAVSPEHAPLFDDVLGFIDALNNQIANTFDANGNTLSINAAGPATMSPWTECEKAGISETAATGLGGAKCEKKESQSTPAPKASVEPPSSEGTSGSRKGAFRWTGPAKGASERSTAWATVWRRYLRRGSVASGTASSWWKVT